MVTPMNELAFYTLAGAPRSNRDMFAELRRAEELGIGSAIISERFKNKEACTLSGAAAAVTDTIGITTGATNVDTRHPVVLAGYASTMHTLSEGRFALGFGRGIAPVSKAFGLKPVTTAQVEDMVGLMRRMWRGETIVNHDGPAGRYPMLRLDPDFDFHIPMSWVAFGPNSLELGGRAFDAVILHTFFTDETLQRCVRTVKQAAERAGRNPDDVRVWSCFATLGDHIPEAIRLKKTVGRLATYLQAYGDLLVRTNNWDPKVLERFRADPFVAGYRAALDDKATTEELEHVATLIPDEWLAPAAYGTPDQCARAVLRQLDLGADGVIMHGASPDDLAPIVEAYRGIRPAGRFDHLAANPGGTAVRA